VLFIFNWNATSIKILKTILLKQNLDLLTNVSQHIEIKGLNYDFLVNLQVNFRFILMILFD